jgi:hypothetical protein
MQNEGKSAEREDYDGRSGRPTKPWSMRARGDSVSANGERASTAQPSGGGEKSERLETVSGVIRPAACTPEPAVERLASPGQSRRGHG